MTPCPTCGAFRFVTCGAHGPWCAKCDGLSCPACAPSRESGHIDRDFLIALPLVFGILAAGWLALVILG